MLERMHAAKNRKEAAALQKQEAQEKAQERIKKIKQRWAMVAALLSTPTTNQAPHPYIPFQVKTLDKTKITLVDSGSRYNLWILQDFGNRAIGNQWNSDV